jgi:hypothetical protein
MKEKNRIYRPEPEGSSTPLSTMTLFERDSDGDLVYARELENQWRKRPSTPGDRRSCRRIEWRRDGICRTVVPGSLDQEQEARTCNISRGGISLLLTKRIEVGSYLDLTAMGGDASVKLPLAEVLDVRARGSVWLISCAWLQMLDQKQWQRFSGRRKRKAPKKETTEQTGWLMQLWNRFRGEEAA